MKTAVLWDKVGVWATGTLPKETPQQQLDDLVRLARRLGFHIDIRCPDFWSATEMVDDLCREGREPNETAESAVRSTTVGK